jgi:hypothetical protein
MPEIRHTPVAVPALILFLLLWLPGVAAAVEPPATEPPATAEGEESLPAHFDRFFGHATFAEEFKGTQLQVNVIGVVSEAAARAAAGRSPAASSCCRNPLS